MDKALPLILPSPLPEKLAVAVSGGADSMALALLLNEQARQEGKSVFAMTVDHRLRADAAKEAEQVAQWMAAYAIPHQILKWHFTEKPTANIQAQAREARYQLMAEWCLTHDIKHLCVGHHLDDQAETFLLRLQRGSGVDGLAAMRPASQQFGITLLRPLLNIPKQALKDYLTAHKQDWIEDPSNQSASYTRTHIRTLIPELEKAGIHASTLAKTAERMARARDFLEQEAEKAFNACIIQQNEKYQLQLRVFEQFHAEIGLRVLASLIQCISGSVYRVRFDDLQRLYHALLKREKARTLEHCLFRLKKNDVVEVSQEITSPILKQDKSIPI